MSFFGKPVSTPDQVRGRLFPGHALSNKPIEQLGVDVAAGEHDGRDLAARVDGRGGGGPDVAHAFDPDQVMSPREQRRVNDFILYAMAAADEAVRQVLASGVLEFAGLHSHIGSQIFDAAGFEVAAHRVVGLAVRIRDEHGVEIAELDLGGGFGIAYTEEDDAPEVKELAQSLRDIVDGQCRAAGLRRPRLTVEPGRAIVGPSTVSLYTVGTIKDVDGLRTYVSVDGGMSDNIRTALYDA